MPLFQNESSCDTVHIKKDFVCKFIFIQTHEKRFARGLVLKERHKVTPRWPIITNLDKKMKTKLSRRLSLFSRKTN